MINKSIQVLIEDESDAYFIAKTEGGKTVRIDKSSNYKVGDICTVIVKKILSKQLVGEIV